MSVFWKPWPSMTKATKPASLEPAAVLRAATRAVDCISASWKLSLQEADRDEVIAEAVGKAWRHRGAYNPRKASLPTWVSRIARNTLLDYLRRRRTAPSAEPLSDSGLELRPDGPDTLLIDKEEVEAILRAIRSLPLSYQTVIILLAEGRRPRDIAQVIGCSTNAAAIRCHRARTALRKKLRATA